MREQNIMKKALNKILRTNKQYQLSDKFGVWKSKTKFVAKEGRELMIKGSTDELEETKMKNHVLRAKLLALKKQKAAQKERQDQF